MVPLKHMIVQRFFSTSTLSVRMDGGGVGLLY
jgi:hypothetical protein